MFSKIKEYISKVLSVFYMIFTTMGKKNEIVENNKVLIISDGHLGDALLWASEIEALISHYKCLGKDISMICSRSMFDMLCRVLPNFDVNYLEVFENSLVNIGFLKSNMGIYNKIKNFKFEDVIVVYSGTKLSCLWLSCTVSSNRKFTASVKKSIISWRIILENYFLKHFTKVTFFEPGTSENILIHKYLSDIGIDFSCSHFYRINYTITVPKKEYIVISIDSAHINRRWPSAYFKEIIYFLLNQYDYDIYLTGNNVDEILIKFYEEAFLNNDRVKIFINKTSLDELIDLIGNRTIHIGVDSGSVHLAAATGTQSFCILGFWNIISHFPYIYDDMSDIINPICIYNENIDSYSCKFCKVLDYGYRNPDCRKRCRKGEPCKCIADVTPKIVELSIMKYNDLNRRKSIS